MNKSNILLITTIIGAIFIFAIVLYFLMQNQGSQYQTQTNSFINNTTTQQQTPTSTTTQSYATPKVSISALNQSININQTTTLIAKDSGGTPPYTYQWYNDTSGNAVAIPGATSPIFSIVGVKTGTFKYYVTTKDGRSTTTNSIIYSIVVNK